MALWNNEKMHPLRPRVKDDHAVNCESYIY